MPTKIDSLGEVLTRCDVFFHFKCTEVSFYLENRVTTRIGNQNYPSCSELIKMLSLCKKKVSYNAELQFSFSDNFRRIC